MSERIWAMGDIHGCARALDALLDQIQLGDDDTLVTLGDYVDRGEMSPDVVTRLIELQEINVLVPLVGNHEIMMMMAVDEPAERDFWLQSGGRQTLQAYGGELSDIPADHLDFLRSCQNFFELDRDFCVHANYVSKLPLPQQPEHTLFWEHLSMRLPSRHVSGKRAIVGHTPQRHGEILDLGHLLCLDTFCYGGGWLTALDLVSGTYWQANRDGVLRDGGPRQLANAS